MTTRDRLMFVGILAIGILVAGYLMVVSPERQKASKITAEVTTARQQLQSAEAQVAEASSARTHYGAAYASLVSLGPAVPASGETPSLLYALASATNNRHVEFQSITSGGSGGSKGLGPTAGSASASSAAAAAAASVFTQEPFSLVFTGSYTDLNKLLAQLEAFTYQTPAGSLRVSGRLLTIDSVQLQGGEGSASGATGASAGGSSKAGAKSGSLTATVAATAYVLPAGQSVQGGGSPSSPSAGAAGASAASTGASGSSPTSAAVVKAGP